MGSQKGRGLLSSCCARSRPLGPAAASPDRQMKCQKASLKSFASYLKALGMRLHGAGRFGSDQLLNAAWRGSEASGTGC